jgi:hypothetical protein
LDSARAIQKQYISHVRRTLWGGTEKKYREMQNPFLKEELRVPEKIMLVSVKQINRISRLFASPDSYRDAKWIFFRWFFE